MRAYDPEQRPLVAHTETGDLLIVSELTSTEQLDGLYHHNAVLVARGLDAEAMLGSGISFCYQPQVASSRTQARWHHGYITRIEQLSELESHGYQQYRVEVSPWLWLLEQRPNCRVFQQLTTADIVRQVIDDHGFTSQLDFKAATGRTREYCVQYNETDLAFICRLMQEEGWHYHFLQQKGKHSLVIADDNQSFKAVPETGIEYFQDSNKLQFALTDWRHRYQPVPGAFETSDYSHQLAEAMPSGKAKARASHKRQRNLSHYFYPGRFTEKGEARKTATRVAEHYDAGYSKVEGQGSLYGFAAGATFELEHHPQSAECGEYLLTRVEHRYVTAENGRDVEYGNHFHCQPSAVTWRPCFPFQKPQIVGLQSAVVTGPGKDEIHTEDLLAIKLQFHWDQLGKNDDQSSCWVRVCQPIAHNGFGSQLLPRVGDEVLVSFVDSDPDRPIVVGSAYNKAQKIPFKTPTTYGLKLQSTPDAGTDNFSELSFECKKGSELMNVQAEKDMKVLVKNDRTETIKANETVTVEKDRTTTIKQNDSLTVEGTSTTKVTKKTSLSTDDAYALSAKKDITESTDADFSLTSKGDSSVDAKGDIKLTTKGDLSESASGDISMDATKIKGSGSSAIELSVGSSKIKMSSSAIELSSGASKMKISASGIEISGTNVKVNGQVSAELKGGVSAKVEGSVQTDVKGTMVAINGSAMTQVKGGAMVEINGAIAKIN